MMANQIKALILAGDGINCEKESHYACKTVGFKTQTVHINDLLKNPEIYFQDLRLLVLPGGFSFADELGSGKVLALKLKYGLAKILERYLAGNNAILGICNGFQVLTRLKVFGPDVLLAHNQNGKFINQWVELEVLKKSVFTHGFIKAGINKIYLPVRHGEGRLAIASETTQLALSQQIALRYSHNLNGSWQQVAGLTAHQGRVLGLMPHPEAFWCRSLYPEAPINDLPLGLSFFEQAFEYFNRELKELV